MLPGLLAPLGWDETLATAFAELASADVQPGLTPGRVVRQAGNLLTVQLPERSLLARPSGRLRHEAQSAEELPAIGDWVVLEPPRGEGQALIDALLPRRSVLLRRQAGEEREPQVIAANVDVAFLVMALDAPVNARRLERMLAIVHAGGARPVIVLTKRDLVKDLDAALADARGAAQGAQVHAVDAKHGDGVEAVARELGVGQTGVLLGASGAGKSTLANQILGEAKLVTGEVREDDRKGRHTTTHRELFVLPGGGLMIDGPGMREFGVWGEDAGIAEAFEDIEQLGAGCRFADCTHEREPGCAVQAAVASGQLEAGRLENFRKLRAERAFLESQVDPAVRRERKKTERALTRAAYDRSRSKKGR